jgi:hypothetical protein
MRLRKTKFQVKPIKFRKRPLKNRKPKKVITFSEEKAFKKTFWQILSKKAQNNTIKKIKNHMRERNKNKYKKWKWKKEIDKLLKNFKLMTF